MKRRLYPILNELKGKIRLENKTYKSISQEIGISIDALNNKINGYSSFNIDEVESLIRVLNINPEEIIRYFFPKMIRFVIKSNQEEYFER